MKVIVAGSRSIQDQCHIRDAIQLSGFEVTELVSGGCSGPDQLAEVWASEWPRNISVKVFLPDWSQGNMGGPLRNQQMAEYAEALVAIWDGRSKGTLDMIKRAEFEGLQVFIYRRCFTCSRMFNPPYGLRQIERCPACSKKTL